MRSKTIVEEKKIEETIKNIPEDWFTVLDFTEVFRLVYPKSGRGWLKGSDSSEAREDTLWRRTSRIDLMYTRRNHTGFWLHSRDIKKESFWKPMDSRIYKEAKEPSSLKFRNFDGGPGEICIQEAEL